MEEIDHRTYDYYLNKVNNERHFADYYYNLNDVENLNKENIFQYEGKQVKITNPHEEKFEISKEKEKEKDKRISQQTSLASTNVHKIGESFNLSQKNDSKIIDISGTPISHRKINY